MNNTTKTPPRLIIVMGVSGCGKSTLAAHIAQQCQWVFLEADDFHSKENREHMASGKPLSDAMRAPWIQAMCDGLVEHHRAGDNVVLAYSGLRREHRQRFRELGFATLFLHLAGAKETVLARLKTRQDHFMPTTLLDSQYDALEPTDQEPDIITIDLAQTAEQICNQAMSIVAQSDPS